METIWKYKTEDRIEIDKTKNVSPLVQRILHNRDIANEDVEDFINPKPKTTHDPFLMKNMDEVATRIIDVINEGKRVCVYGDYDVDGITSVSLLTQVLKCLTSSIEYYIPSRFDEGYGLNKEALAGLKESGVDLVITVDCGTVSFGEVDYCNEIGLEIIVTDHHTVGEKTPNCLVLNIKQEDCNYPFDGLCGCGVAFKLAQAIQRKASLPKEILKEVLDLVALATIADIVPLVGENRVLAKYGLAEINKKKRPSIKRLIEKVGLNEKKIESYEIAFILAPHLNAAGRLDSAYAAVKLLTTEDKIEIEENADLLLALNLERRAIQEEGYQKCCEIVEEKYLDNSFLVVDLGGLNEGVAGIIAGKVKEKYNKPTIIVTKAVEEGILKGTGRSIENIDIHKEMKKLESSFLKFGGHAKACGFSMKAENLDDFRMKINKQLDEIKEVNPDLFQKVIYIDVKAELPNVSKALVKELELLKPYGYMNERPMFVIENLCTGRIFYLGEKKNHVKTVFYDSENNEIEAIGFNMSEEFRMKDLNKVKYSVVGYPEINSWKGNEKLQFVIKDVKIEKNI